MAKEKKQKILSDTFFGNAFVDDHDMYPHHYLNTVWSFTASANDCQVSWFDNFRLLYSLCEGVKHESKHHILWTASKNLAMVP